LATENDGYSVNMPVNRSLDSSRIHNEVRMTSGQPIAPSSIVLIYFLLPSRPTEAKFLAPDEKDWIIGELARERERKLKQHQISLAKTFTHLRVWHLLSNKNKKGEER
jgi:hypothetical protein